MQTPTDPNADTSGTYSERKQGALERFHAAYLQALLEQTGGNISEAARRAGVDRSNFRRILKRWYGSGYAPPAPQPAKAPAGKKGKG